MPVLLLLGLAIWSAAAFNIDDHRITSMMVAVYTPMTSNGKTLDLDVIPKYAKFIANLNITNVMPCGSNGESLSLTVDERKALAEAWAQAGPKEGLKVYMHIGSESLIETTDLARHAAATKGITGILAMTPVYFKPTIDTLHDFMAEVGSAAPDMPFWFYHFPDDTGVLPGQAHAFLEMADKSGKIPNLMGIKYTDYNLMDFQMCLQVGTPGKYNMLYGRDEQLLPALELGAEAGVSSTAQYSPTLRNVATYWSRGNITGAKDYQILNALLCSQFGAFESQAQNVQKNIMRMVGMDVGPSRLPKRDLSTSEFQALETSLRQRGLIDVTPTSISTTVDLSGIDAVVV